jgi:sec-independent protein translocase protein TatC
MAVCFFNDRRRERRRSADPDFGLDPDEASSLSHVPEQIAAEPFDAEAERRAVEDFDDAT